MTISVGDYVKVIYEFEGEAATDLPLKVDDVVLVTGVPDKNWFTGQLVWDNNSSGNFPSAFVEALALPSVLTGQKVFLAIEDFPAEQAGDLDFVKGDVIIGLESRNGGWWKGKNGPLKGIFPLTYVIELSVESGPRSRSASARSNSIISGGGESFDCGDVNRAINDLLTQKKTVYARALVDIKPQLDGELGFQLGDIIELTDAIDDDWFYGSCHNKEGLVSSVCVEFIDAVDDNSFQEDVRPQCDQSKAELGHLAGSNDSKSRTFSNDSYNSENTRSHDAEIAAYGRVLYPFSAQLPNELSLCECQLVNLIQHVDSDWTEGEVDGKRGIFPTSFVEIIVDCPFADNCAPSENINTSPVIDNCNSSNDADREEILSSGQQENHISEKNNRAVIPAVDGEAESHEIGLVVHTFMAEVSQDITVSEGDTVEVLRHVNGNWLEIKTDTGLKGLVPRNHIDIIGPWPPSSSRSAIPPALPAKTSNGPSSLAKDSARTDNHRNKTQLTGESNMFFRPGVSFDEGHLSKQEQTTVSIPATTAGKPIIKPKPPIGKKPTIPSKPALNEQSLLLKPPLCDKAASVPANPTSLQTNFYAQKVEEKSPYTSVALNSGQTKHITDGSGPFTEQNALLDRSHPLPLRKKEPLKNMKDISSSANSKSFSEKVSPLVSPEVRRRSASTAEQEMFNASKQMQAKSSEEKTAFVNRAFQIEIDEGLLVDVKHDKPSPPRRPPPRNASPRPHSLMVGPDLLSQESQTKLRPPPPRPTGPRIAPAPGKSVLVPIKVDPQPKIIPKRPAPKAPPLPPKPCLTDTGQEIQAHPQPPRRPPPPPVSFPPPPVMLNPEDLMSFSPGEFDADPASPELVMDIKTKLEENQKDIKVSHFSFSALCNLIRNTGSKTHY